MPHHVEYEDTVGFAAWMERNLLSRFRDNNARFFAVLGVMVLAVLCTLGIGDEAGGVRWDCIDKLLDIDLLLCIGVGYVFRTLKNPACSRKTQAVFFLLGAAAFLFVVLSSAAVAVLYYGFGFAP